MAFTLAGNSGITGFETDENGLLTRGRVLSVPVAGLDTTASLYAPGCQIVDASLGKIWLNIGTSAVPSWVQMAGPDTVLTAVVSLSAADIVATTTGKLNHTQGLIVVPAAPSGYINQFICGVVSLIAGASPTTAGGNTTFNIGAGGAAITGLVSSNALFGSASSIVKQFVPLSTVGFSITKETSINLVVATSITQPAGGTDSRAKVTVLYRVLPV